MKEIKEEEKGYFISCIFFAFFLSFQVYALKLNIAYLSLSLDNFALSSYLFAFRLLYQISLEKLRK
jgi:hypothetical protein